MLDCIVFWFVCFLIETLFLLGMGKWWGYHCNIDQEKVMIDVKQKVEIENTRDFVGKCVENIQPKNGCSHL